MRPLPRLARGAVLGAVGALVLWLEYRHRARPYSEPHERHTVRNLAIAGLAAGTVHVLETPVVLPLSRAVGARRWGLLPHRIRPGWLREALAVLLMDYTLYLWHILAHRASWLWRFHLVHHVDLDLDASTGLRFHAGELAASVPSRAAQVLLIGVTPRALTVWQTLTLASVLFHHSNAALSARTERILSWLVATPRMHAIHHSVKADEMETNFSSGLAIWDRLHGTFRADRAATDVSIGVPRHPIEQPIPLGELLALPFRPEAAVTPRG